jgi:arginyl-tRNA synthetase
MPDFFADEIKKAIRDAIFHYLKEHGPEDPLVHELTGHAWHDSISLEIPPDTKLGDYAFPCFSLSKKLKKSPLQIAQELFNAIKKHGIITEVKVTGPYLNFFIDKSKLAELTLEEIHKQKDRYGMGSSKKERVMAEYFQANTHKAMHIGHIRNISLGESLARILAFSGFDVLRANYQGDIGPHVAKCLWGYLNLNGEGRLAKTEHKGVELGRIYTEANSQITGNEGLEAEIREMTKKLYDGDKSIIELWMKTREMCIKEFDSFYKEFNVQFDQLFFESEVEEKGRQMVKELEKMGISKEDQGAMIVDLNEYGLGIYLVLRSDGVALYSTKDLALAKLKFEKFKVDRSLYVVGREQELYFQQLFKTLELMGFDQAKKCFHLSYGLVMLPEGKMSSREGNVILYQDLRDRLYELARQEVMKRHEDWPEKKVQEVALKLTISALKFSMVLREPGKDIVFEWERSLDFEGETAAYVQYSYARICSIFKKHGKKAPSGAELSLLTDEHETALVKLLADFPKVIADSSSQYKPHLMARYAIDLAKRFNEFYQSCRILQEEDKLRDARLYLAEAAQHVLKTTMALLNVDALEEM